MKKEKKTELTKEKILNTAIKEFGTYGYSEASINRICDTGISKGLIYHNFANKEDLYICCVRKTFEDFMKYLWSQNAGTDFHAYMRGRSNFFHANHSEARIFFETILHPPTELQLQMKEIKAEFDAFNKTMYLNTLEKITLRKDVSKEEAIKYFKIMKDMFNDYFYRSIKQDEQQEAVIEKHEKQLMNLLDFMFYGIAERRE